MGVSVEKYWNTWSTLSPAVMEFLPAGFAICPGVYSDSAADVSSLPFGENIRLREHEKDGRYTRLTAEFHGTVLEIEYAKADAYAVLCRIRTLQNGEWGLRFMVNVALGFLHKPGNMQGTMGAYRSYRIAAAFADEPIRVAFTDTPDEENEKMRELGYYAPEIRKENPRFAVAKFNLELTPEIRFAVCAANSEELAQAGAEQALLLEMEALKEAALADALQIEGTHGCAAEAIRDVMAWNAVYDHHNHRPFTSITRYWIDRKFGGWFVWLDDLFYHGLISLVSGDTEMARENILAALSNACPAGNFACLMSEYTEWVDRSQPPIGAFIVYKYYLYTGDTALLQRALPLFRASIAWWKKCRRTPNGLFAYGSGNLGNGHFKDTKLAAKDESSMDNSPMHDTAEYDKKTHLLDMNDIALNCLLVMEAENTAQICRALGQDGAEYDAFARELGEAVNAQLYDEEREIYANRKLDGSFASVSPTSFYPMTAGIAPENRQNKLLAHMFDEKEFFTFAPFPAISADDPAAGDDIYWRGRMWPPLNFMTHAGLRRTGHDREAYRLAKRCMEVFEPGWREENACYENVNAFTGVGKSPDADPYYGWGALIPLMWVLEHIDVDAQFGLHAAAWAEKPFILKNGRYHGKRLEYQVDEKEARLSIGGALVFAAKNLRGRIRHIRWEGELLAFTIDPQPQAGGEILLQEGEYLAIWVNGELADPENRRISLPEGTRIEIRAVRK